MINKKKIIQTESREIYEKLIMLHFSNEVLLRGIKDIQIDKILKTINKDYKVLEGQKIGDYFIVKRIGPINYDIYLK